MAGGVQTFFREAFTKNLRLKGLAIFITVLIFGLVRGGREATARVTVDAEVLRPDPTAARVLMTDVPETLRVRVRGSSRLIEIVTDEEIPPVTLDFRDSSDGPFDLERAPFRVPPGLEVVSVVPASVDLRYEERVSRVVPVVAVLTGEVAPGHHVRQPVTVEPTQVTVSGPASEVVGVTELRTVPVVVARLGPGEHERRTRLETPEPHTRYVEGDQVLVTLTVQPDVSERALSRVPVAVRGAPHAGPVEPVSLTLRGPPAAVAAVRLEAVAAFVDLGEEGDQPGRHRAPVQVDGLPAGVEATAVPPAVEVEVSRPAPPAQGAEAEGARPAPAREGARPAAR